MTSPTHCWCSTTPVIRPRSGRTCPRWGRPRSWSPPAAPAWGSLGASLQIGPFTDAESASFLVERTRLQDPVTARQLAADLGNLPLACAQAAAFIEQSGVDLREYRELFQRSSRQLLERGAPDGYGGTVGTTWQIGFNRVAADAPQAAYLLEVLAFLSPDGVPTRLVRELFGAAGPAAPRRRRPRPGRGRRGCPAPAVLADRPGRLDPARAPAGAGRRPVPAGRAGSAGTVDARRWGC